MSGKVLLVEDDAAIATVIRSALEDEGFAVDRCDSIAARDRLLSSGRYDVMLTDVMLADGDGIATIGSVRAACPAMPLIVLSAQNTLDTAVRASDTGAFEYFPKPFDLEDLVRAVSQAVGSGDRRGEEAQAGDGLPLVGRSPAMQAVYRMITRVLRNDLTVLILGESGTGKELVAEAIHELGHRKSGPFVAVNAAAIPADLIESELFGHEKGAFTGAIAQAIGKFEQANGGTLFLDEIGDMPLEAQTRLLRALQSGRIRRVGGRQEIAVDVRIVAATNRDLKPMIASGRFREDLFYRLNVVPIQLPPLRDRPEDIEALAKHFLGLLILGESGTGKELVAEAIHELGHRKSGPFVAVNAAAIPADLIESELFGHEKGAFTGAIAQAIGKFEQANGGTLFLDEIGDMPLEAQTRLLRALQSGRIRRVGGRQEIAVDVRIVAATNRDLKPMIASGRFREDLFYRLNVVPIQLPPLRDRPEDIEALAKHFLGLAAREGLPERRIDRAAIALLENQRWRGNVRELQNTVYRLALMARDDVIDAVTATAVLGDVAVQAPGDDSGGLKGALSGWLAESPAPPGTLYHRALAAFERPLFEHALRETGGNQLRAAKLLGINRNTLRKKLAELDVQPESFVRTG